MQLPDDVRRTILEALTYYEKDLRKERTDAITRDEWEKVDHFRKAISRTDAAVMAMDKRRIAETADLEKAAPKMLKVCRAVVEQIPETGPLKPLRALAIECLDEVDGIPF